MIKENASCIMGESLSSCYVVFSGEMQKKICSLEIWHLDTPMKQLYPSLVKWNKEFSGVVYNILGKRLLIGAQVTQRQLKAWVRNHENFSPVDHYRNSMEFASSRVSSEQLLLFI